MRDRLIKAFDKLERDRLALIARLDALPTEKLERKPSPDEWAVTQVMAHLTVAETGSLHYLRKKLEVGGHAKASAGAGFRKLLLKLALALPFKYKAPRVARVDDSYIPPYAETKAQWQDVRDRLRAEYEKMDAALISHDLFKHPFAGKMNVVQSVEFMQYHMDRHIGQVDRILKSLG